MAFSRFDVAVAGDTLAARMAAALLARRGRRVLHLTAPGNDDPWLFTSLFLRKLVDTLGGQASTGPYAPFQVLSRDARITIDPLLPLADELQREFADSAPLVEGLLSALEETGQQLEELLWDNSGLPDAGARATAHWRWLCLRRKFPFRELSSPLAERLRPLPDRAAAWLTDLFQGLAVQPLAALSVADAALLWAACRRPEGIAAQDLAGLLQKRFEQFHGVCATLADLSELEHREGSWRGTQRDGGGFQATELVLGDANLKLPGQNFSLPRQPLIPPQLLKSSPLDGQLSPLLENLVIAGGAQPLRLALTCTDAVTNAKIQSSVLADETSIRQQLEPVLPFAQYSLHIQAHGPSTIRLADPTAVALPLFKLPLHLGSHLWCLDETHLTPQLGATGAALLAWTLVHRLLPASGHR